MKQCGICMQTFDDVVFATHAEQVHGLRRSSPKPQPGRAAAWIVGILVVGYLLYQVGTSNSLNAARASSAPLAINANPIATVNATVAPTPAPHIGTVVQSGNWRYQVMQVDTAQQIQWGVSSSSIVKAKGIFILVLVDLTNVGNRNFPINYHDFELRDDKGITYDGESFTASLYADKLGQVNLGESMPPGVVVRTTLLFDVAPGTTGMRLHLVQGGPDIALL